jgi:SNF2 family DNA or RNA helicase
MGTKTTNAALSLHAEYRLAISGTPVENNLADLYSLFRFLNPAFFGSHKSFMEKYMRPIQEGEGDDAQDALSDLKTRIYPFILRRLKRDVLKDLPEKTEETLLIELDKAHLKMYHKRRLEFKQMISGIIKTGQLQSSPLIVLRALTQLRRLASVPEAYSGADGQYYSGPSGKRQYLAETITNLAESGHKALVFCNFLAGVSMTSADLAENGIASVTMTGATVNRQKLVDRFQTESDIKAFIMTLKTGGAGINLTAADYVFIMDPWWNAAAEMQAVDRAHRFGQRNPVFCYRLIAKDTIEERIMELQKRKRELANALFRDDASTVKSLSAEDITYLVHGDEDDD